MYEKMLIADKESQNNPSEKEQLRKNFKEITE
jgi:hypothetical protein